jgi:hypothetical protein
LSAHVQGRNLRKNRQPYNRRFFMGVEFVFPPSGKVIRLVVFSEKIGSQESRQEEDDKKKLRFGAS